MSTARAHSCGMLIAGAWCDTKLTADMAEGTRLPVFCYGSNGIEQMRDRCRNDALTARRARLPDASRVFGGWSERWGGAVASVKPLADHEVQGSVVDLDLSEIILLDHFEAPNPDRPYSADAPGAVYHRQDVVVLVEGESGAAEVAVAAMMYIKVDCTWRGPPSQRYLDSCARNVAQFWDGGEIAVRDEHGNLRQRPGGEGPSGGGAGPSGGGASGAGGDAGGDAGGGGGGSTAAAAVPPAAIASASAGQGEIVGRKGKGKAAVSSAGDHDGVTHFDAAASKTVQALVEAFGFPMAQAVTAVDAIRDKGDVNLAVQWLIDEGEEDHGGAVEFVCDTHLTLTDPNPDPEPHPHPDTHPNQVRCTHLDDPAVRLIAPSLLVAGTHAPSATAQPTCSQVS
jgi:uncharacterized membrane protein YgcG